MAVSWKVYCMPHIRLGTLQKRSEVLQLELAPPPDTANTWYDSAPAALCQDTQTELVTQSRLPLWPWGMHGATHTHTHTFSCLISFNYLYILSRHIVPLIKILKNPWRLQSANLVTINWWLHLLSTGCYGGFLCGVAIVAQIPVETSLAALGTLWQLPRTALTVTDKDKPQTRPRIVQLMPDVLQDRLVLLPPASTMKYSASGLVDQVTVIALAVQFIWTCTFWGAQGAGERGGNQSGFSI